MGKNETRMDVVILAIFDNLEEPANWSAEHDYEWKPSIAIQYQKVDKQFKPIGEKLKAKSTGEKKVWMFQAMGGKKAKGHFFDLMFENGETNGYAWTSFKPLAELFKNSQVVRIQQPEGEEVQEPLEEKRPELPPEAGDERQDPPPPPVKTGTTKKTPTMAERANTFMDYIATPQSDAWWTLKTQMGFDGADAFNVLDMAKQMAAYESYNMPTEEKRVLAEEALDYWIPSLRRRLLAMKQQNIQDRLLHLVTICQTEVHIQELIDRAYRELPLSGYDVVRNAALVQYKTIKEGTVKVTGTIQPEVLNSEPPKVGEKTTPTPAPSAAPPPGLDPAAVTQAENAIGKYNDFTKLLAYWESGAAPYKAHEGLRDAFRLKILDMFMKAEVQGAVDLGEVLAKTPLYLHMPSWVDALKARYAELPPF